MFSYGSLWHEVAYGTHIKTHMRASVETLCAIASVEEERFVLLDLRELVPQTFDLSMSFQPDPNDILGT